MSQKVVKIVASADGTQIYADAIGDPQKPALVFLHGFSTSASVFNDIFTNPSYSEDFFLVRYDLRGAGRSGKPNTSEGYLSKKYADDFAAVLKAFNITQAIFIGWSMGGTILADVTAHLPPCTLFGAVILCGSPCTGPVIQQASSRAVSGLLSGLLTSTDSDTVQASTMAATRLLFIKDSNPPEEFASDTIKKNELGNVFDYDGNDEDNIVSWETRCMLLGMSVLMSQNTRLLAASHEQDPTKLFELGKQGFPLLLLHGAHDGYMSGKKVFEELQPIFTNIKLKMIEKGGSHIVFLENPEEIMDSVLQFANDCIRSSA